MEFKFLNLIVNNYPICCTIADDHQKNRIRWDFIDHTENEDDNGYCQRCGVNIKIRLLW